MVSDTCLRACGRFGWIRLGIVRLRFAKRGTRDDTTDSLAAAGAVPDRPSAVDACL